MLFSTLNLAIETYLKSDPHSARRLKKLEGKALQLTLQPFEFICYGVCENQQFHLTQTTPLHIHASIEGTPLQLACLNFANAHERQRFFAEDIHVNGDPAFAQEVMQLFHDVKIDWEEIASHCVGDAAAYRLTQVIHHAKKTLKQTLQSFTLNVDDYLHEETQLAPHPEAIHDFMNDVDEIHMRTERLLARVHHLTANLDEDANEIP